jgi:DMSO/TMAO reductase YedYZ molybdopterin-dependent catalytic subunit
MRDMDRRELRLAGLAATAVALSALWLVSAFVEGVPFPPTALAERLVRVAPGDVATFFIDVLAHWAMRLLTIGVIAGALWLGAEAVARSARRSRPRPVVAGALLAAASIAASLLGPASDPDVPLVVITTVAAAALDGLIASAASRTRAQNDGDADPARRHMLQFGVGAAVGVALAGGALGWIARRWAGPNTDVALASPDDPATIPAGRRFPDISGLTPEITSAEDHYVVDIDLVSPSIDAEGWTLSIGGELERPLELTFARLQSEFEVVEDFSVLTCVSNEVGGILVGNSAWGGVRLGDVLDAAGARDGAVDVVFRAADGYSDSIPLEAARAPGVILAFSQNGEPLTQDHGFPCRVRIPGIYGMKNVDRKSVV